MEIEAEVLVLALMNARPQNLCTDSRVSHVHEQWEKCAGSSSAWRSHVRASYSRASAGNMRQGGHVLQQRDRRAQLGKERSEAVGVGMLCGAAEGRRVGGSDVVGWSVILRRRIRGGSDDGRDKVYHIHMIYTHDW